MTDHPEAFTWHPHLRLIRPTGSPPHLITGRAYARTQIQTFFIDTSFKCVAVMDAP